jgi:hypothetical protein
MLRQVDWIVIARELGEADDVFIFDRLANRRSHADRKIFEIKRLKQRILHARTRPEAGENPSVRGAAKDQPARADKWPWSR